MRRTAVLALVVALGGVVSLHARTVAQKKQLALQAFQQAERLREAFQARPESERTLPQYRSLMDAYRKVYYTAPNSSKADVAIVAVAELLADAGRQFHDDKMLRDAVGQYEFLRREYPGSRFRLEALLTEAEIYGDDLGDDAQARTTLQDFLKHYPHGELADQARAELAELNQPAATRAKMRRSAKQAQAARAEGKKDETGQRAARTAPVALRPAAAEPESHDKDSAEDEDPPSSSTTTASEAPGKRVFVTGVRHWTTAGGTRIAIELSRDVQYSADRIDSPERIYFDLHNTKLMSGLNGKSIALDDGLVKKIRIAQFQRDQARVVLEIADAAEYSAFVLPNPTRLIVDVHSRKPAKHLAEQKAAPPATVAQSSGASKKVSDLPDTTVALEPDKVEHAREVTRAETRHPALERVAEDLPVHHPAKEAADAPSVRLIANAAAKPAIPVLAGRAAMPDGPPPPAKHEVAVERTPRIDAKIKNGPLPRSKKAKRIEEAREREAEPIADGDRTLIRALGLKIGRIVVDAGHGGHDTGTIGPNGLMEKDVVLDVALRLGKLLETRLGAEVTYTRDDDTFIPLETRTAIANQKQADLFISVHANSSNDPKARGVETYYLNFTSSADALEVAARENAVSDKSIHELQDLVKKIALKDKIDESREFAGDVESSLYSGLSKGNPGIRKRGVKKAPFIVLIGANMPSILAEISFVSNPTDAKKLQTAAWRERIAESLYRGVEKYVSGLSGLKVASETKKQPEAVAARP